MVLLILVLIPKGTAHQQAQFVCVSFRVVATCTLYYLLHVYMYECKDFDKNKKMNNSRFCHFPVSYLAFVSDAY